MALVFLIAESLTVWFDLHQRLTDTDGTTSASLLLIRQEMVVSQKKLGEFCEALKQYLKNVSAQRDCFHVTAVRLPDGLSFVVYEFWDGEAEWKSCLVQCEQGLSMKTFNYTPRLLDTPHFSSLTSPSPFKPFPMRFSHSHPPSFNPHIPQLSFYLLMSQSFLALYFQKVPSCHPPLTVQSIFLFSSLNDSQSVICRYCGSSEWGSSYTDTNNDLAPFSSFRPLGCIE
ncbi:hypothetical protein PAMP_019265 [Pampus punctatissimus]